MDGGIGMQIVIQGWSGGIMRGEISVLSLMVGLKIEG